MSGRTTLAVLVWLFSWGALHAWWRRKALEPRAVYATALALIALGIVMCFPLVWALVG